ncbi:MAG: alpha/beta hydrolase [Pseudomonadota bacterium]
MATFTTSDGLSLHYTDDGAGLPLLCLAGLTRTGRDFDYVRPLLPPARVITLDYRGRGMSDWDPNPMNYVPEVEGRDVLELLDHLGVPAAAILGTSRGGLLAMGLAATVPDRLLGVCLNDVGPEIDPAGIAAIMAYLGKNPPMQTHEQMAAAMQMGLPGFVNVPETRWLQEARTQYRIGPDGLEITYDPGLRAPIEAGGDVPDLWPLFDALAGKPLALIRGAGSNLLRVETATKMQARRPDMIFAEVPDRGHVPFLDEPEALAAIREWMEMMT